MRKVKHILATDHLLTLYYSLIYPYFDCRCNNDLYYPTHKRSHSLTSQQHDNPETRICLLYGVRFYSYTRYVDQCRTRYTLVRLQIWYIDRRIPSKYAPIYMYTYTVQKTGEKMKITNLLQQSHKFIITDYFTLGHNNTKTLLHI